MIVRFLAGFILAMMLSTMAIGAVKKAIWTDQPDGVVYKMQKSDAIKPATRYQPLTPDEIRALVPAPTREEIEAKAVTFGMAFPVPVTKAFIEAEASKLGMVYPAPSSQPDFTLLEKVFVNGGAPCTLLRADIVKPLGNNVYMAKVNLWDSSKPVPPGACN